MSGMKKTNRLLLIYFFLLPNLLFAEVLRDVEIVGNKRTKKNAIIQHGNIKIGQDIGPKELQEIKDTIGRIGQIRLKDMSYNNGILRIEVEDKWTIFPVPMITQSGSYKNRGFLVYDDNFLGTLGTFAPGVSWSNSIFNYLLYFQDESLFSSSTGIKFLLMKKSDYVEFLRNDVVVDSHESRYDSYLITPNYLYKEHVFKAGPAYIDRSIYKDGKKISRNKSKGIFFRHHLNGYRTLEVMYEGLVTTFDIYALKSQEGKSVFLNEANAIWSIPIKSSFLNFGVHGYLSSEKSYQYAKNIGGDEGFRGYDKASFPVSSNYGAMIQYQQHLFNRFFLSPFYEYNSSKLIAPILNARKLNENTIGAGIRYYFKKISIPAVILDMGRNIEDKSNHFHLNIGVSI